MAVFSNLHHVAQVLAQRIASAVEEAGESPLPPGTVQPGPPLENPSVPGDAVRVTLLYLTPSAQHRNQSWQRGADGTLRPPPLGLSAFFLITCYGSNGQEDPVRALQLLGHVLQGFHSRPMLSLPLPQLPTCGEGSLEISQEPLDLDRVERVLSPLQVRHRPFALFEVGPIQLAHLATPETAPPLVLPGGPRVGPGMTMQRPVLSALLPPVSGPGGVVRLVGSWQQTPGVFLSGLPLTPNMVGDALMLTLPNGMADGVYSLQLVENQQVSELRGLRMVAALPGLDAPPPSSPGTLLFSGRQLAMATTVIAWPDSGVLRPSDLHTLSFQHTAAGLLIDASALTTGRWRLSVGWPAGVRTDYSSYVLLELHP